MQAFTTTTGTAVPLRRSRVDTDQICPSAYMKRVTRTGYEDALFSTWRSDPDFVLNRPRSTTARSWSPDPTSGSAPPASTRCGR